MDWAQFYPNVGSENRNYCRNPGGSSNHLWCAAATEKQKNVIFLCVVPKCSTGDDGWSAYGEWSECTSSGCGIGTHYRSRTCIKEEAGCVGEFSEIKDCSGDCEGNVFRL